MHQVPVMGLEAPTLRTAVPAHEFLASFFAVSLGYLDPDVFILTLSLIKWEST